ncbi:MAG: hypothetical protein EOP06_04595 [Proteobacteria bacterium]|nr:MAG: hypothetical protein EOP06_04595 [Pseudomonadota bacterium]
MLALKAYSVLLALALISISQPSQAALTFTRNPRTLENQDTSLISKGLADACLGMLQLPDGLNCNPANSVFTSQSSFGIQVLISNGYSNLENVRSLLTGEITPETIDRLFSDGRFTQIETNASVIFKSKFFSGSYTPLSVRGFSIVRNEGNPEAEVQFVEESGFTFQSGWAFTKEFSVGLQTRVLSRKSVHRTFKLVELATESGRDLLKPQSQNIVFLEPGATWIIGKDWQPRLTLFVHDVAVSKSGESYVPIKPEPQLGFAITPTILPYGTLDLLLEYRRLEADAPTHELLHFGANYRFGAMNVVGGVDGRGLSGGVFYFIDKLNAGVVYSTTNTLVAQNNFYTQTVYAQLGWQL